MPPITALVHTENDALRLGRLLETLYACDEVLVVDHDSRDSTAQVAREYGARVVSAVAGVSPAHYLRFMGSGWVFCLDPRESLTESLAASVYEWKLLHLGDPGEAAFSVFLREETATGWDTIPVAETRLIPPAWNRWHGLFPTHEPAAITLDGELLRFCFP